MRRVTTYRSRGKEYPQIQLRGAWLEKLGYRIGDRIAIHTGSAGLHLRSFPSKYEDDNLITTESVPEDPQASVHPMIRVCVSRPIRQTSYTQPVVSPQDAADLFKPLQGFDREVFWSAYLDSQHHVVGIEEVAIGCLDAAIVHPREVYKGALLANASGILIAHNHPSGNLEPSESDLKLTDRLYEAGELLGVGLLDHLIVGHGDYRSLRESWSY